MICAHHRSWLAVSSTAFAFALLTLALRSSPLAVLPVILAGVGLVAGLARFRSQARRPRIRILGDSVVEGTGARRCPRHPFI